MTGRVRGDVVADAEIQVAGRIEVQPGATDVAGTTIRRATRMAGGRAKILTFGTRRITRSEPGMTAVPSAVNVKRLIWL